jgi:hypothetical protein
MKCVYDGCVVTAEIKKEKYVYYRCSGYRGKCDLPRFREEDIANRLGEPLKGLQVPPEVVSADAESIEPGHSRSQEVRGAAFSLVWIHGRESDARVVVDGHMQELGTDALDAISAVAGDAVRWPLDAHQTLDIQVQHVARSRMFVAVGRQRRLDVADAVQLRPAQHTADRRMAQPELVRDPDRRSLAVA